MKTFYSLVLAREGMRVAKTRAANKTEAEYTFSSCTTIDAYAGIYTGIELSLVMRKLFEQVAIQKKSTCFGHLINLSPLETDTLWEEVPLSEVLDDEEVAGPKGMWDVYRYNEVIQILSSLTVLNTAPFIESETKVQKTEALSREQKIQVLKEYQELQENGQIGESLLRTLAESNPSPAGSVFDMEIVGKKVALELALEFSDLLQSGLSVVVGQSPITNFNIVAFTTRLGAEQFINQGDLTTQNSSPYIEELQLK